MLVTVIVGLTAKKTIFVDDSATVADVRNHEEINAPSNMSATVNGAPSGDNDPIPQPAEGRNTTIIFALAAKNNA